MEWAEIFEMHDFIDSPIIAFENGCMIFEEEILLNLEM